MDCKITSSSESKIARSRGMTLVEVMIASALGTMALAAVMAFSFYSARSFAAVGNYVDLDMKSRNALDRMSQEIRQADGLRADGYSDTQLRSEERRVGKEG